MMVTARRGVRQRQALLIMALVFRRTVAIYSASGRSRVTCPASKITAAWQLFPARKGSVLGRSLSGGHVAPPPSQNDRKASDNIVTDVNQISNDTCPPKKKDLGDPHDEPSHGILHQVEHRAKEKGSIELGKKMTEETLKLIRRATERGALIERGAERVGERAAERAGERAFERAAERGAERAAERIGERAAERAGERAFERAAERGAERAAERIGERAAERTGQRTFERAVERGTERVAERIGERAAERTGQHTFERVAERGAERAAERISERAAERAGERVAERAAERVGERAIERAGERGFELIAERTGERTAERIGERAAERVGERTAERVAGRGAERAAERIGERTVAKKLGPIALTIPERVALRIGRGVLIALPALGGIFALYLMKTDTKRAVLERKTGSRLSFMLFGGAAVTDAVDAVCHFTIAFALLMELGHHFLAQVEEVSLGCAFVSTLCAVIGEVVAYRRLKKSSVNKVDTVNGQTVLSPPPLRQKDGVSFSFNGQTLPPPSPLPAKEGVSSNVTKLSQHPPPPKNGVNM